MNQLILHHYPESLFSEKIRLLLGYKAKHAGAPGWNSVTIPIIMPKPELMPLTGGYRKTPVLQQGAEIYCDTAIISRHIDALYPRATIFPREQAANAATMAFWTDTFFFKVCVAVVFQPKALASNTLFQDQEAAAAFAADRASLSEGSNELGMALEVALPHFYSHLNRLEHQLSDSGGYLFGVEPTIADFSTYHCLWFILNNPALSSELESYPAVAGWYQQMADHGHGEVNEMSGADALAIAREASPQSDYPEESVFLSGFSQGQTVSVQPIDYGFNPVSGQLLKADTEELIVLRTDEQVGEVAVHFPTMGFQLQAG